MKKNLSFLSKVGVAAASVALVSGLAWALPAPDPETTTDILTVPATIEAGSKYVFVGFQGTTPKVLANTTGTGVQAVPASWTAANRASYEFEVKSATTPGGESAVYFDGKTSGTETKAPNLKSDGTVAPNDLLPEVMWFVDGKHLKSASSQQYLYFDASSGKFQTTTNASMSVTAFKVAPVKKADISDNGVTSNDDAKLITKIEAGLGDNDKLKYEKDATYNPTITVSTSQLGDDFCVVYKAWISSETEPTEWSYTTDYEKTANISLTPAWADKTIKVKYATASVAPIGTSKYILDVTEAGEKLYDIVDCSAPVLNESVGTYDATAKTLKRDATTGDAELGITVPTNAAAWSCIGEISETNPLAENTYKKITGLSANVGQTVTINLQTKKDGFVSVISPVDVTVVENLTNEEVTAAVEFVATPASGTSTVNPGTTVKFWYKNKDTEATKPAYNYDVICKPGTGDKINVTLKSKDGDNVVWTKTDVEATTVAASGTELAHYELTVPAEYNPTNNLIIEVPENVFALTQGSNEFLLAAATISYGQSYKNAIFTVEDPFQKVEKADANTTAMIVTGITLLTPSSVAGAKVKLIDPSNVNTVVKVTDSKNVPVSGATVEIDASNSNKFNVTLPAATPVGEYMVVFPAYSLCDGDAGAANSYTNQENVTAYISVKEKCNFTAFYANNPLATTATTTFCSNDKVYLVVKATGAYTGSHPVVTLAQPFVHNGKTYEMNNNAIEFEGDPTVLFVSTPTVPTEVAAGMFKANNSKNTALTDLTTGINANAHTDYYAQPAQAKIGASSVTFNITNGSSSTTAITLLENSADYGSGNAYKETDITLVAGEGAEAVKADVVITTAGKGTISLKGGKVFEKDVTYNSINIPADIWTASCNCKNKELTVAISTDDCDWTITLTNATAKYTTNDTEFPITVSASYFDGAELATPTVHDTPKADLLDAENNKIGEATITTTTINAFNITASGKTLADVAKVKIPAGAFKTSDPESLSKEEILTIDMKAYVSYELDETSVEREYDTKQVSEFSFKIITTPSDVDIAIKEDDTHKFAIVDGSRSFGLTVKKSETDSHEFTATLKKNAEDKLLDINGVATEYTYVPTNNYTLSIPAGILYANNNANDNDISYVFQVKDKVSFSINGSSASQQPKAVNIDKATTTFDVTINATDVETGYDMTSSMFVDPAKTWTISAEGVTVTSVAQDASDKSKFHVTLSAGLTADAELTIPAEYVKANFSKNAETKVNIVANDVVTFDAEDVTINQTTTEFEVDVTDGIAVSVLEGASATIAANGATPATTVTVTSITESEKDGKVKVTLSGALAAGTYTITFTAGGLKANYTVNGEFNGNITVQNEMVFIDEVADKTTTTIDEILDGKTYAKVDYTRTFTGKVQAMSIPFDVKLTADNLDGIEIYKLYAVTLDSNGNTQIAFKKAAVNDNIYANMPYLIKAESNEVKTITFINAIAHTKTPDEVASAAAVSTSTVSANYTFNVTVDGTVNVNGKFVMSKSQGLLGKVTSDANLGAWRWYMDTTNKSINYAKIIIDGFEDEITGITNVETSTNSDAIYTTSGVRLTSPKKGSVNIINGKKIYIK